MVVTDDYTKREYQHYYGENKVGRCGEVLHDYLQCMKRAIDSSVECSLVEQDMRECIHQRKQRAALEAIEWELKKDEPLKVKVWEFLTR